MTLNPPTFPNYETAVLEPELVDGRAGFRFNITWYLFLSLLQRAMIEGPAAETGSSIAGSITLNSDNGIITTEALATASAAVYALTIIDNTISGNSNMTVNVTNGTNTGGTAVLQSIAVADGSAILKIINIGPSAFNGTLKINFLVN